MVLKPAICVGGYIVTSLDTSGHHLWYLLHGTGHCVQGELHLVLVKETKQTPEARSTAVLKFGFRVVMALIDPWRAGILTQIGLGLTIATED